LPATLRENRKQRRLLVAGAVVAVLWYLAAANTVVAMSYRVSEYEGNRTELLRELETLRSRIATTASPDRVEERALQLGFEEVSKPLYLPIPGDTVARR
jgi:hypothetical protein